MLGLNVAQPQNRHALCALCFLLLAFYCRFWGGGGLFFCFHERLDANRYTTLITEEIINRAEVFWGY